MVQDRFPELAIAKLSDKEASGKQPTDFFALHCIHLAGSSRSQLRIYTAVVSHCLKDSARERLAGVGNINLRQTIRAEKSLVLRPL